MAAERRAQKPPPPPNENIEVADGIVVTRNVRKRLMKQAESDIPRSPTTLVSAWVLAISASGLLITLFAVLFTLSDGRKETVLLEALIGAIFFAVCHASSEVAKEETCKRLSAVTVRLEELARDRERQIDEARAFYASAEWRLVRWQAIKE